MSLSDYLARGSELTAKSKLEMTRLDNAAACTVGYATALLLSGPSTRRAQVHRVAHSDGHAAVDAADAGDRPQRHLLAPTLMNPWLPTGTPTLIPTPTGPPHPFAESTNTSRTSVPVARTTLRMASLLVARLYLLQCEQRPRWIGDDGHGPIAQLW